jgi:hypothetical protein
MSDVNNEVIIAKILETIARYRESVAGVMPDAPPDAVRTARFVEVGRVILALSYGNEGSVTRAPGEEIVHGLGAPGRLMIGELFWPPEPSPLRGPFKVTAEILPVVEAMFSIGLPDPGWHGVEVEVVVEEPAG